MNLREKQAKFAQAIAELITAAFAMGLDVTLGEAYRSPEEAARLAKLGKGIKTSLHTQRLAIDLNLFADGRLLTDTEDYRDLGEWWETEFAPLACWGGRFGDGNHFSFTHGGRK